MSRTNRRDRFLKIREAFQEKDNESMSRGRLPMRSTARGFWGTSHLDDVWNFFEQMAFPDGTRFMDLGCGDGRVVLVASLFVTASGVEYDEDLIEEGREVAQRLGIKCALIAGDIRDIDFSAYDALYMYADQNFSFIREKLLAELAGTLYLYHDTYHPEFLEKGRITWVGQIPVFSYARPQ